MRISDWSSDVCSSDLYIPEVRALAAEFMGASPRPPGTKTAAATAAKAEWRRRISVAVNFAPVELRALVLVHQEVDRKSVVEVKSVSVRVDLGARRFSTTSKIQQTSTITILAPP